MTLVSKLSEDPGPSITDLKTDHSWYYSITLVAGVTLQWNRTRHLSSSSDFENYTGHPCE